MKIKTLNCMKCFAEDGIPSDKFYTSALNDEGFYELVCEKGHETIVILQEQKFEILFEIGAHALIDGYPDAAVTRFAVALERFYEFYSEVVLLKQGIRVEEFSTMWKNMSNLSERQFGAFLVAYQLDKSNHRNEILPTLIEKECANFRNKVTHKGYIPSDKEARNYGRKFYNFMGEFLIHIKKHYSQELSQVIHNHLRRKTEKSKKENGHIVTMSVPTLISIAKTSILDFDEAIFEVPRYSKYSIQK